MGAEESGVTRVPVPRRKPGPRAYAAAHTAAFGTSAMPSSSTASRPDQSSVSCRKVLWASPPCQPSDTASSSAPPPTRTAVPATAALAATPGRPSGPRTRWRASLGSTLPSARSSGPFGPPYAVRTPAPAATAATSGTHTPADAHAGRSTPPAA